MIDLSPIISGIKLKIDGDVYLDSQLGNNVTFGTVPQQAGSSQTTYPYCAIYSIGDGEALGAFGGNFMDRIILQFSVWTHQFALTSSIINAIGVLFNNASLILDEYTLVDMKRVTSERVNFEGQDKANQFIYKGVVSFRVVFGGC